MDWITPCTGQTASTLKSRGVLASASRSGEGPFRSLQQEGIPAIFTSNFAVFIYAFSAHGQCVGYMFACHGTHEVWDCKVCLILVLPKLYVRQTFLEVLV